MPHLFQDAFGWWICQSCDSRGLITGLGPTAADAKAAWAELIKRLGK